MRAPPNSCTHTPLTPERPARSTSSQIMPAFMTHFEKEKSEGGRIGEAIERIGSLRWYTRRTRTTGCSRGLALRHVALDHDLGMRRHRQPVHLARDHVVRRAAMAGRVVEFGQPEPELVAAGEEEQRIVPAADQHRARLAGAEILLADLPAMLARRDP